MNRSLISIVLVSTATAMFVAPVAANPTTDTAKDSLAKVGEVEVSIGEIRKQIDALPEADREALRRDSAALNQYVRSLLTQQLVLREAKDKKWDQNKVVAERMDKMRDSVVASTFLEAAGAVPDSYPNDADLQAAYEANKAALKVPKSWRLAQIFIADPKGAPVADAAAKLTKAKTSASSKDVDFAVVAAAHSEDPSTAGKGGEIGWLAEEQVQPAIRAVLPSLALNSVSEPIRLDDGWHIIKVLDAREAYTPTLEQIRTQLAARLKAESARAMTQEYLANLLKANPIAINEMALPNLLPAAPSTK